MPDSDEELLRPEESEESESELDLAGFKVTLQPHDWTVSGLVELMRNGRIDISPTWQRRDAWDPPRRSQYIESVLLELPVPQIVLAERLDRPNHYVVIDGKQRLSTLRRFLAKRGDGVEAFNLGGLSVLKSLEGHTFESIQQTDGVQHFADQLLDSTTRTVVIRNWTHGDFLHFVFLRLNQGTLPLKPQELRQALFPGPFTQFMDSFSLDAQGLHAAMGIDKPDPRMQDTEVLVRFLGFRFFIESYAGNLKKFLDWICETLTKDWGDRKDEIQAALEECEAALAACVEIFGKSACRLWLNGQSQRSFNRAVFDAMAYYLRDPDVRQFALRSREEVKQAFIALCAEDADFIKACQSTTKTPRATFKRLDAWGSRLAGLGAPVSIPTFDDDTNRIRVR